MKIKIKKKIQEMSGMTGSPGSISGHVDNRKKLEESDITSNVSQNDSTGYTSEVTFNGITSSGRDYQVVQELGIQRTSEDNYVTRHQYPEIYKMIGECLPDSIKKTSFEQRLVSYDIDFKILYIGIDGQDIEFDSYDENIFSKMDSLKFFRHIMKEVGEYIVANPDKVYYFYGIHSGMEMDTTVESMRTKLYRMFLKRLFKMLPGNWKTETLKDVNQILFWKCPSKQAELVFESKETDFTNEEIDLIHELYSTSGINMMGAGLKQIDPTPEQEEERYKMNLCNKGLLNYKSNEYFTEETEKKPKIKIKIIRNLGERCEKGYKTHEKRKTKKMFGKTYRNCV